MKSTVLFVLAIILHATYAQQGICILRPIQGNNVSGNFSFTFDPVTSSTTVTAYIAGLTPNSEHGIHVHQWGDIRDTTQALATGGHFNPYNEPHGIPPALPRHAGDMGNVIADANGVVLTTLSPNSLMSLNGNVSLIGRSVIVHSKNDTGAQPTGDAGSRIAQCVIGIMNPGSGSNTANSDGGSVATCEVQPADPTATAYGRIIFTQTSQGVNVQAAVCGLNASTQHGFHVHLYGDLTPLAAGGFNTAGHYNPTGVAHGYPDSAVHHVGDMGNLTVSSVTGVGGLNSTFSYLSLSGAQSIVGRAVIIHSRNDQGPDFQPTGNAGVQYAACVIGVATNSSLADVVCSTPTPTPTSVPKPTTGSARVSVSSSVVTCLLATLLVLASLWM